MDQAYTKRKPVTILTTTSASLIIPSIFKCMRESPQFEYRIVAVDAEPDGVGAKFSDIYYVVPMGSEGKKYISKILALCHKENVDVILPISDEENLVLSAHKHFFDDAGIKLLCNNHEATKIALRKDLTLEKLESEGYNVPNWSAPKNIQDFDADLKKLGFPNLDVVIKPISARGSRGFRIIKQDFDEFNQICKQKEEVFIKPERIRSLLNQQEDFPPILLMEYLPGQSFSIDIFAENGNPTSIIPHKRVAYRWGFVDRARLIPHSEACSICRDIVKLFNFDNLINIELNENEHGQLRLIEINPRASATLAQNRLAGLNILDMAVASVLEEPMDIPSKFKNVEYTLYWEEAVADLGTTSLC